MGFWQTPPPKKKNPPILCRDPAAQSRAQREPGRGVTKKKAILAAKTRPNLVPHGAATPREATPERGQAQGVSPTPPAALRGDSSSSPLVAAPSSGSGPWVGAGSKLPAGPWLRQHLWHLPDPPVPPWHSWGHPQTLFSSSAPHGNNTRDALPAPPRFFFFETRQGMGGPQTNTSHPLGDPSEPLRPRCRCPRTPRHPRCPRGSRWRCRFLSRCPHFVPSGATIPRPRCAPAHPSRSQCPFAPQPRFPPVLPAHLPCLVMIISVWCLWNLAQSG